MVKVNFGTKNDTPFELTESNDLIVVRTHSQRPLRRANPVVSATAREVMDGQLVLKFEEAGVEVYRVPTERKSVEERKLLMRREADVRFAGSVLVHSASQCPVLYTENIYVRFVESLDVDRCRDILRVTGLAVKRELEFAPNAFFLATPEGTGQAVFELALSLLDRDDVVFCHPELISRRETKAIFPQQWHLAPSTIGGNSINAHANVAAAHALTLGDGVVIAIIDEGLDVDHPELSTSGKLVAPRDATKRTDDPRPKYFDENHGTACAGVACASGIDGASGVAPRAKLMPIRLYSGLGSIEEAEAFRWAAEHGADVISCSWGPSDGYWANPSDPLHQQQFDLPASTRDAIDYAITRGRGGKGCVITWAAGNGNESVDLDGYASNPNVIAVAACNDTSKRSAYSDFGNSIWCSFPSDDVSSAPFPHPVPRTSGIWTTDVQGTRGYNPGNPAFGDSSGRYTNSFGGTSSACPGAAGVAALVISRNPDLRYFEVRDILAKCCDRIDPSAGQYDPTTGRSVLYGHGRLNAAKAVDLAILGRGQLIAIRKAINETIPDLGAVEAEIEVANSVPVEDFSVQIRLRHTYIGDLLIILIPPPQYNSASIVLHNRTGGNQRDLDRQFDASSVPSLAAFRNTACAGVWKIRVEDKAREDSGMLDQVSVILSLPPDQSRNSTVPQTTDLAANSMEVRAANQVGPASRRSTGRNSRTTRKPN